MSYVTGRFRKLVSQLQSRRIPASVLPGLDGYLINKRTVLVEVRDWHIFAEVVKTSERLGDISERTGGR